jgi:hypothetical protein
MHATADARITFSELPHQDIFTNVIRFKNLYFTTALPEQSFLAVLPVTKNLCLQGINLNRLLNGYAQKVLDV